MTPEREKKLKQVIQFRQFDLTVVLDKIEDPHNIFAVLRTCDAVGIASVYVIDPEGHFKFSKSKARKKGKRSSVSARKWVDVNRFEEAEACFAAVRQHCQFVYGTHLDQESKSLYDLNLTESVALVFGNEKKGISADVLPYLDGNFVIPQLGIIRSLNISVACAVSLYEAHRQRAVAGKYDQPYLNETERSEMFERWSRK